jgi:hypothetical protein
MQQAFDKVYIYRKMIQCCQYGLTQPLRPFLGERDRRERREGEEKEREGERERESESE